jgi:hypothetical protein
MRLLFKVLKEIILENFPDLDGVKDTIPSSGDRKMQNAY